MTGLESPKDQIDLRGIPCPLNFVRVTLALERLKSKESLYVELDKGEPEEMVLNGLREAGHNVQVVSRTSDTIRILILCKDG